MRTHTIRHASQRNRPLVASAGPSLSGRLRPAVSGAYKTAEDFVRAVAKMTKTTDADDAIETLNRLIQEAKSLV